MKEKEIKEILMKRNKDFRETAEIHSDCEKKLNELKKKPYLSSEDQIKERELKKKKLSLKDRMYKMISEYKKSL
jgi:uncharacterized protein